MSLYRYKGNYTEFRGKVFAHGVPVKITDQGTLDALAKRADFELVKGGDPVEKEQRQERQRALLRVPQRGPKRNAL